MTLPNWAKCASICSSSSPAVQAGQHCQLLQQQRHALSGGAQSVRAQGVEPVLWLPIHGIVHRQACIVNCLWLDTVRPDLGNEGRGDVCQASSTPEPER